MARFFFSLILLFGGNLFAQEAMAETLKEKGYLWIRGFYSPEQVDFLRSLAGQVHQDAEEMLYLAKDTGRSLQVLSEQFPELPIVVPERKDPLQVCRTEDLLTCYPDLSLFVQDTLATYLGSLLDEPYVAFKDKLNFKRPGGGAFPYHQDFPAFEIFGPEEHITAMVCIDAATLGNGCLQIAENWRESFKDDPRVDQDLLDQGKAILEYVEGGPMHGTIVSDLVEKLNWIPVNAEPGDVVFFTSYVPHFSKANTSNASRRAMFFTFNRLIDGEHKTLYYQTKREDPENPRFHFGTPTNARNKGD